MYTWKCHIHFPPICLKHAKVTYEVVGLQEIEVCVVWLYGEIFRLWSSRVGEFLHKSHDRLIEL